MIDPSKLESGRATDKLVAEAIGWTDVGPPAVLGAVDLVGIPPDGRPDRLVPVPFYSGSTAILFAVEIFQAKRGGDVKMLLRAAPCGETAGDQGKRWTVHEAVDGAPYYSAGTLWLGLAKMIAATSPGIQDLPK